MESFPAFHPGTKASLAQFCLIIGFVIANQYYFLRHLRAEVARFYVVINLLWATLVSISAAWGWTRLFFPFSVPLILVTTTLLLIFFAKTGVKDALTNQSSRMLILASGFRLPLELVLHSWSATKTIPESMTWTGSNFDILPGALAFLVLIPILNKPWFHKFFFLMSTIMLINVIRVVLMSANLPFSWNLKDPLQLIFEWPYCLIAVVLVPWALQLNVALGYKLFKQTHK